MSAGFSTTDLILLFLIFIIFLKIMGTKWYKLFREYRYSTNILMVGCARLKSTVECCWENIVT